MSEGLEPAEYLAIAKRVEAAEKKQLDNIAEHYINDVKSLTDELVRIRTMAGAAGRAVKMAGQMLESLKLPTLESIK